MYFWERKNGIRDSDEKSAGCGIFVKKEREYGIRTPPSSPCYKKETTATFSAGTKSTDNCQFRNVLPILWDGSDVCDVAPPNNRISHAYNTEPEHSLDQTSSHLIVHEYTSSPNVPTLLVRSAV